MMPSAQRLAADNEGESRCVKHGDHHGLLSVSSVPVKRHRGEPGARDTHGTHKRTRGHTEDTDEPDKHPNPRHTSTTTRQPKAKPETAADTSTAARTAAGPEPTTPRGRLRRGRPQRTRPCLHPLPERLPVAVRSTPRTAWSRSAKNGAKMNKT